jgi:hypothetical protein
MGCGGHVKTPLAPLLAVLRALCALTLLGVMFAIGLALDRLGRAMHHNHVLSEQMLQRHLEELHLDKSRAAYDQMLKDHDRLMDR